MNSEMKRVPSVAALVALVILALAATAVALLPARTVAGTPKQIAAGPTPLPSPDDLFLAIRNRFRSHRPPPPYETYTLTRAQQTSYGYPDYNDTYLYHIWYRSNDHAAMERKHFHLGAIGNLEFKRPMFNIADDPGPPTADVFEPAPLHTITPEFVPTPEASMPPVIATIRVRANFDYRVTNVAREGNLLHLSILPKRDPDRNRLREIWVDANTLDLKKIIVTDKLFIEGGPVYPTHFTIDFSMLEGIPVITHIHGVVDSPDYDGDGKTVEYEFKDLTFPQTLPSWYFNARDYAQHLNDAPDSDN
jgi:hypothetical protein